MTNKPKTIARDKDLIYDVGMHKGEDTEYYLKKGFRVIAFEADNELVEENKKKFSKPITEGALIIVEGAIVDEPTLDKVRFFKNLDNTAWGTTDLNWAIRNENLGARNQEIEVHAIDFSKSLERYGIPYYMKIDIEGADLVCLEALGQYHIKPSYLSVESEKVNFDKLVHELDILTELGYAEFTAVQQAAKTKIPIHSKEGKQISHRFARGSSGLFGRDLNNWVAKNDVLQEYRRIFARYERYGDSTFWQQNRLARLSLHVLSKLVGRPIAGWYDTHARLPD